MNERLTLQDIIDSLAKKKDISKKDAENFLREFISVISENIETKDPVKIKDFGTFKLIKVNARKSVDVNTGEAIEIPAHYKLGFTPDRTLKDSINRPLAHFESILLNEGVNFDNIDITNDLDIEDADEQEENNDTNYILDDNIPPIIYTTMTNYNENDEVEENNIENVENVDNVENLEEITSKSYEDTPKEAYQEIEQKELPPPLIIDEPEGHLNQFREEPQIEQKKESGKLYIAPVVISSSKGRSDEANREYRGYKQTPLYQKNNYQAEENKEYQETKNTEKKKNYWWLIILLLLLALLLLGFIFRNEVVNFINTNTPLTISLKENEHGKKKEQSNEDIQKIVRPIVDTVSSEVVPKIDSVKKPEIKEEPKKAVTKEKKEKTATTTFTPITNVVLRNGQTLRQMALKYYNNKSFWVYIYQENKNAIKNPNNVPIGTKLVIPSPLKYGINAKSKQSLDKAKTIEKEIFTAIERNPSCER